MVYDFHLKPDYNYFLSTEDSYACDSADFVGKYQNQRSMLDYSHHRRYSHERQHLHDQLIDKFLQTRVHDYRFENVVCDAPLENWIVFTAGPMGSGKGHTMQWLHSHQLFPADAFVNVNPDIIRELLPEFPGYIRSNPTNMGFLTQKEVGYICEVLTYDALLQKKNVLVDGSLRNVKWYSHYFRKLRSDFPLLRIAIIHVSAPLNTVLMRARKRAEFTGRIIPDDFLTSVYHQMPESMSLLGPLADFHARIINEDNRDPYLEECTMRAKLETCSLSRNGESCQQRSSTVEENCSITNNQDEWVERKVLWTLHLQKDGSYLYSDSLKGEQQEEIDWRKR